MGKDITHVQYTYLIHLTFRLAFIDDVPNHVEHHGKSLKPVYTHRFTIYLLFVLYILFRGKERSFFFLVVIFNSVGDNSVDLSLEALVAWCEC